MLFWSKDAVNWRKVSLTLGVSFLLKSSIFQLRQETACSLVPTWKTNWVFFENWQQNLCYLIFPKPVFIFSSNKIIILNTKGTVSCGTESPCKNILWVSGDLCVCQMVTHPILTQSSLLIEQTKLQKSETTKVSLATLLNTRKQSWCTWELRNWKTNPTLFICHLSQEDTEILFGLLKS